MKKKICVYVDIPTKIYYINYFYDYSMCEIFENKFFYDRDTAYKYAEFKGLNYYEFDIEELKLGAINKEEV